MLPGRQGGNDADGRRERISHARRAGNAGGRAVAAVLVSGGVRGGPRAGESDAVRPPARRGPRALPRQVRSRRPARRPLLAPRRLAVLRAGGGARHRVRLPRLALRHGGQHPGDPARAQRRHHPLGHPHGIPRATVPWHVLGLPRPAPLIPKYDLWERKDGTRRMYIRGEVDCNWFQTMENAVDPAHLQILHQEFVGRGRTPASTTRGYTDDVVGFEFYVTSYGIMKRRTYTNGVVDQHPLIFPNIL